jgi:hypothetical protein
VIVVDEALSTRECSIGVNNGGLNLGRTNVESQARGRVTRYPGERHSRVRR